MKIITHIINDPAIQLAKHEYIWGKCPLKAPKRFPQLPTIEEIERIKSLLFEQDAQGRIRPFGQDEEYERLLQERDELLVALTETRAERDQYRAQAIRQEMVLETIRHQVEGVVS
jgi:hypothetical protein